MASDTFFCILTADVTDVRTVSLQLKYLGIFIDYTVNLNVIWHCGMENFNCIFCASNVEVKINQGFFFCETVHKET